MRNLRIVKLSDTIEESRHLHQADRLPSRAPPDAATTISGFFSGVLDQRRAQSLADYSTHRSANKSVLHGADDAACEPICPVAFRIASSSPVSCCALRRRWLMSVKFSGSVERSPPSTSSSPGSSSRSNRCLRRS